MVLLLLPAPALVTGSAAATSDASPPTVTGWSFNADSFEMGDTFTITFDVADDSNVRSVYFSMHHEASGGYSRTFGFSNMDLPPGRYNASFNWTYGARGNYTLGYFYTEDVLGNGRYTFASSGGFPADAPRRVFLGPSQVDVWTSTLFGPYFLQEGEVGEYSVAVHNLGDAPVGAFDVTFLVDDVPHTTHRLSGLGSGAQVWLDLHWTAVAGSHEVRAVADHANELAEANESNNELSRGVSVAGTAPDLVAVDVVASPPSPWEGETVHVNATIRNDGDEAAGAFAAAFLVDGVERAATNVSGLAVGASTVVSFAWEARAGEHALEVVADARAEVGERSESNNGVQLVLAPAERPDLVALPPAAPNPLTEGDVVNLVATVLNARSQAIHGFHVDLLVDGVQVARAAVDSIEGGSHLNVSFPWRAERGWHDLAVVVDPLGEVDEVDESNNLAFQVVFVDALPGGDVSLRILDSVRPTLRTDLGPLAPHPVADRTVLVEVSNAGPSESGEVEVQLWARSVPASVSPATVRLVGVVAVDSLAANESRIVEFAWRPVGFVGDVDLVAEATPARLDPDATNNRDTYRDFVLVGGTGLGVGVSG